MQKVRKKERERSDGVKKREEGRIKKKLKRK